MIATRTLPSSRPARPFVLPLVDIQSSKNQLLADVQDALQDSEPRRGCEEIDRPGEQAPRSEYEAGGDYGDALGTRAHGDVAPEPQCLPLCPDRRHEDGAGDAALA